MTHRRGRLAGGVPLRVWGLSLLSVALLALSVGAYAYAFPTLLPLARELVVEAAADPEAAGASAGAAAEGPDAAEAAGDQGEAGSEGREGDSPVSFGAASLSAVTLPDPGEPSGDEDAEAPDGEGDDTEGSGEGRPDAKPGADAPSGGGAGDSTDEPAAEPDDDFATADPTEEGEREFRAFLIDKASAIPGYASQASSCASAFSSDSVGADLSTRRARLGECRELRDQLVSEYIAVRDYRRPNGSSYLDAQERTIASYRCLASYVDCYCSAWELNVLYDDPAAHVDAFTGPLSGCDGYISEFHSWYDGLTI